MLQSGLSTLVKFALSGIIPFVVLIIFVSLFLTNICAILPEVLPTSDKGELKNPETKPLRITYEGVLSLVLSPERFLRRLQ